MKMLQLFGVIVFLICVGFSHCELPVVISRGAFIKQKSGVIIYNDVELLHHIISDLPDPPASIVTPCPQGATKRSCDLSKHLHHILEDNAAILQVLNKARTTLGLSAEDLPKVTLQQNSFRPIDDGNVNSDPPGDDIVKVVGREWYEQIQALLEDRKPLVNGTYEKHHTLNKRFIQYIKPLLIGGAALMGADDLIDFFGKLFVGENGIAKFLTTLHATTPQQSIVDLSRRISKFEAQTRIITSDISFEARQVQKITNNLQKDVAQHKMDLSTVEDSHLVSQQLMSDMGGMMYTYGVYLAYMFADTECRAGYLSPLLLPPYLLAEKLSSLALLLPSDLKLAIGLDEIQKYYTTKTASCVYDSHGGLTTVSVPIVFKGADYKLYEYRNIFFAWEDKTCTLQSASRYIIKDIKGNKAYPIEDVDEEKCAPHLTKKCRVPPESDSAEAYCLTQLLSSSTSTGGYSIRDACKMACFDKKEMVISQMSPNMFVGVHVPTNSMSIDCPNHERYNITEHVPYGSLRVVLHCSCTIRINEKIVGRSAGPACQGHESATVDILLPAHWSLLTDYLPFTADGTEDGTKFKHRDEIFNSRAVTSTVEEEPIITTEISIISIAWNFLHSLILAYMMFRINVIHGAGAVASLSSLRMVEASDHHYCRLEEDVYYILYALCALSSQAFVPPIIFKCYSFITHQFWSAVDVAADRRLAESGM